MASGVVSQQRHSSRKTSSYHDLAALTLTELIQYSVNVLSKPAFVLYLDAKSAFDRVHSELLILSLFDADIKDQGLVFIDKRLANRKTVCEWNKVQMGPSRMNAA